jgi:hypothetical protein
MASHARVTCCSPSHSLSDAWLLLALILLISNPTRLQTPSHVVFRLKFLKACVQVGFGSTRSTSQTSNFLATYLVGRGRIWVLLLQRVEFCI